jgi:hypothetical protein
MRRTPRLKDHHSFGIATLLVRPAASAVKSDSENVHQRPRANMSAFYFRTAIIRVGRTFALDVTNAKQTVPGSANRKTDGGNHGNGRCQLTTGGPLEHLSHLDPHIRTAFGFIGITEIEFVGVGYDEFPDDRIKGSLAAAEVKVRQLAHQLATVWTPSYLLRVAEPPSFANNRK